MGRVDYFKVFFFFKAIQGCAQRRNLQGPVVQSPIKLTVD